MHPSVPPRSLAALVHDRRGVVGIYFAIIMSTMILLSLAALDMIRVHMARARVAMAVDSAILAAGRSLSTLVVQNNPKAANWRDVGAAFYNANINSVMGLEAPMKPTDMKQVETGIFGVIQVDLTVKGKLPLMSAAFGTLGSMDMVISSTATNRSQVAEMVMVLDNTGSMTTNNNIGALRSDAADLITILANGDTKATTLDKIRVGLVPYAATVNPGAETKSGYVSGKTFDPAGGLNWKGCLVEPSGTDPVDGKPYALKDSPPKDAGWRAYEAPSGVDNNYTPGKASTVHDAVSYGNDSTGPNVGCPTPITPMTQNAVTLRNDIAGMQAWSRGGTISDIGLAWGYRLLSPAPPFTSAVPFRSGVPKYLVMMTDGEAGYYKLDSNQSNNKINSSVISDYAGYGRVDQYGMLASYGYTEYPVSGVSNSTAKDNARNIINKNIAAMCTQLKNSGVVVFTITFGGLSTDTKKLYSNCAANGGRYFDAPDQTALKSAFHAIGYAVNELLIVK